MYFLDEETLKKESKINFNDFINREKRSLITYTKDSNLMYIPKENLEKFRLVPKENTLYIPLAAFVDRDLDENEVLFHIYYELALYSDWKNNPLKYLNRKENFKKEIDEMTIYILKKVKNENLSEDKAYTPQIISAYVKREILDFLYIMDRYYSLLTVFENCPVYRIGKNKDKIKIYLKETLKENLNEMPKHRAFSKEFTISEIKNENPFTEKIFGENLLEFTRLNFIKLITTSADATKRDEFIKSFIYPVFLKLWTEEIDETKLNKSKRSSENLELKEINPFMENEKNTDDNIEISREEEKEILEEMLKEKSEIQTKAENIIKGRINLKEYGVDIQEQELFEHYKNSVSKERNEMKNFWKNLIGKAVKEVNVRKGNKTDGKLDVLSLIENYPLFVEAEQKGSYKNLRIFSKNELEKSAKELPDEIEITFLVDNSGSMDKSKIEAARKTITLTLLSIEDFNKYLQNNRGNLKSKVKVKTEIWYFGSNYYKIKDFYYNSSLKEKSALIKSITKLKGDYGATDDASCLKEINKNIDKKMQYRIKNKKLIKMIFVITDGASSFPGLAKNEVNELIEKNIKLFAFQIGKNSDKNKDIFNYIWNEDYEYDRGLIIGEDVDKLPQVLIKSVRDNIKDIFEN